MLTEQSHFGKCKSKVLDIPFVIHTAIATHKQNKNKLKDPNPFSILAPKASELFPTLAGF